MKCPECRGKIVRKRLNYPLLGINLGKFSTLLCTNCGEKYYDEEAMDQIDKSAKEKKLFCTAR